MKVFVLAPRENWICDRIAQEWHEKNPETRCDDPQNADVLWLLAGWCWNHIHPDVLLSKKVVLTVHHIVPDKFTDDKHEEFVIRDRYVDAYHVPNKKTAQLVRQLTQKPIFIVSYWYDQEKWKAIDVIEARKNLNLSENKFIIGSFQRDTEGQSGLPKLEKGPDLFCETVKILKEEIDEDIHVLLGGWRRSYVMGELEKMEVDYTLNELADLQTLQQMYAACDLYIVSSRHEGGPQALLEASSMKVPIISRDVGMATEVLTPYSIFDLPKQICLPTSESIEANYKNVQRFEISHHKRNYLSMFSKVKDLQSE